MKPDYLLLRGFEGILSGMGVHEIEIDFSVVPDGIVVFDGPERQGKDHHSRQYAPLPRHAVQGEQELLSGGF